MKKLRVAVICSGTSSERDVSLLSGKNVFSHLDRKRFIPRLVTISKQGKWSVDPMKLNRVVDVAFLALHGTFGEDGRIQALLEQVPIPYTGSGVLASALAMDKWMTWQFLWSHKIDMPHTQAVKKGQAPKNVRFPCVVKPSASGSSIGISIVRSRKDLNGALKRAFRESNTVLIQEYIVGREVTCGVLGNADLGSLTALPPVEIVSDAVFFDYKAKYQSVETQEICPAPIGSTLTRRVKQLSAKIHELIGCRGLTRSDFIFTKSGRLVFLEINTLPGLTERSLCPKEAIAAGISFKDFLTKQIELAFP